MEPVTCPAASSAKLYGFPYRKSRTEVLVNSVSSLISRYAGARDVRGEYTPTLC